jgi:hypothetical protein
VGSTLLTGDLSRATLMSEAELNFGKQMRAPWCLKSPIEKRRSWTSQHNSSGVEGHGPRKLASRSPCGFFQG